MIKLMFCSKIIDFQRTLHLMLYDEDRTIPYKCENAFRTGGINDANG